jgi:5-methylcytosine-specific restriction enzyme A
MYEDDDLEQTLEQAIQNLAPLCANCHRMVHKNRSVPTSIGNLSQVVSQYGIYGTHGRL